jgi:type I restriction enzyme M protein
MVEDDVVDCMIALPGQLFYSTQISACLWFLARNKGNHRFRDRRGQVLCVDARKLGHMVGRTRRELPEDDIAKIAGTCHAWRGKLEAGEYRDIPGFCKAATIEEIRAHNHILTPGRYVGAADVEDADVPFEERFVVLKEKLEGQFVEAEALSAIVRAKLERVGING